MASKTVLPPRWATVPSKAGSLPGSPSTMDLLWYPAEAAQATEPRHCRAKTQNQFEPPFSAPSYRRSPCVCDVGWFCSHPKWSLPEGDHSCAQPKNRTSRCPRWKMTDVDAAEVLRAMACPETNLLDAASRQQIYPTCRATSHCTTSHCATICHRATKLDCGTVDLTQVPPTHSTSQVSTLEQHDPTLLCRPATARATGLWTVQMWSLKTQFSCDCVSW
mmetsp:Transcript_32345/g.86711  ORF Transcript_32345/g.86711 Transcript_32345/m.86711 type:complete len:219 (+) Transcript_32345:1273-1929(+)